MSNTNTTDHPNGYQDDLPDSSVSRPSQNPSQTTVRPLRTLAIIVLIAGVLGIVATRFFGTAPVPDAFVDAPALHDAMSQADQDGRVVVAVATADYCPPCQALKRSTLADRRFVDWLETHAVPVYVDVQKDHDAAQLLGVRSIPTMYVLRGDEVLAKQVGYVDTDDAIAFLENAVAQ